MSHPWRLAEMSPADAKARLQATQAMIIPAGAIWPRAEHLPLGSDLLILDRVADDLATRLSVPRAPVLPFGVHAPRERRIPGAASLTRKTLHRIMNELIASWDEEAGVRSFLVLTAHAEEPHQEALSTIRTGAVVKVVDILEMELLAPRAAEALRRGDEATALLAHLHPDTIAGAFSSAELLALAERGAVLYEVILGQLVAIGFGEG